MADGGLTKTDSVTSVTSFTSDMLEDEEVAVELGDPVEYDSAPYDIAYHHPGTGQIIVAKEGGGPPAPHVKLLQDYGWDSCSEIWSVPTAGS